MPKYHIGWKKSQKAKRVKDCSDMTGTEILNYCLSANMLLCDIPGSRAKLILCYANEGFDAYIVEFTTSLRKTSGYRLTIEQTNKLIQWLWARDESCLF